MPGFFEDLLQGWGDGRIGKAHPARMPPGAAGNDNEKHSLAEVTALAEQLQARVDELESELAASSGAVFAQVLRLSGVKTYLLARFHPDKHPEANETERRALTEDLQKINAAYEALERTGSQ